MAFSPSTLSSPCPPQTQSAEEALSLISRQTSPQLGYGTEQRCASPAPPTCTVCDLVKGCSPWWKSEAGELTLVETQATSASAMAVLNSAGWNVRVDEPCGRITVKERDGDTELLVLYHQRSGSTEEMGLCYLEKV